MLAATDVSYESSFADEYSSAPPSLTPQPLLMMGGNRRASGIARSKPPSWRRSTIGLGINMEDAIGAALDGVRAAQRDGEDTAAAFRSLDAAMMAASMDADISSIASRANRISADAVRALKGCTSAVAEAIAGLVVRLLTLAPAEVAPRIGEHGVPRALLAVLMRSEAAHSEAMPPSPARNGGGEWDREDDRSVPLWQRPEEERGHRVTDAAVERVCEALTLATEWIPRAYGWIDAHLQPFHVATLVALLQHDSASLRCASCALLGAMLGRSTAASAQLRSLGASAVCAYAVAMQQHARAPAVQKVGTAATLRMLRSDAAHMWPRAGARRPTTQRPRAAVTSMASLPPASTSPGPGRFAQSPKATRRMQQHARVRDRPGSRRSQTAGAPRSGGGGGVPRARARSRASQPSAGVGPSIRQRIATNTSKIYTGTKMTRREFRMRLAEERRERAERNVRRNANNVERQARAATAHAKRVRATHFAPIDASAPPGVRAHGGQERTVEFQGYRSGEGAGAGARPGSAPRGGARPQTAASPRRISPLQHRFLNDDGGAVGFLPPLNDVPTLALEGEGNGRDGAALSSAIHTSALTSPTADVDPFMFAQGLQTQIDEAAMAVMPEVDVSVDGLVALLADAPPPTRVGGDAAPAPAPLSALLAPSARVSPAAPTSHSASPDDDSFENDSGSTPSPLSSSAASSPALSIAMSMGGSSGAFSAPLSSALSNDPFDAPMSSVASSSAAAPSDLFSPSPEPGGLRSPGLDTGLAPPSGDTRGAEEEAAAEAATEAAAEARRRAELEERAAQREAAQWAKEEEAKLARQEAEDAAVAKAEAARVAAEEAAAAERAQRLERETAAAAKAEAARVAAEEAAATERAQRLEREAASAAAKANAEAEPAAPSPSAELEIGEAIEGNYNGNGAWYRGTIRAVNSARGSCSRTYDVVYDDNDVENSVERKRIRRVFDAGPRGDSAVAGASDAMEEQGAADASAAGAASATRGDAHLSHIALQERLLAYYLVHDPSKVGNIEKIVTQYEGREEVLFKALKKKYGSAP
jgi:hypothetical protein